MLYLSSRNLKLLILLIILYVNESTNQRPFKYTIGGTDLQSANTILNITADIIKDTTYKIDNLLTIKKRSSENAPFEIGYLMYTIQEKFRRMVDKYNTSHYMRQRLYLMELVLYLEEIEHHYWEVDHLTKMLHEIERKYHIETELNVEYVEPGTYNSGASVPSQYESVLQSVTSQQKYRYVFDQLGITDKDKIRNLTHEQLADAKYKIHQTDGIRDECSRDIGFQVGMVIGQIREKYKSMLEIYRQTRNKHNGKSKLYMPRRESFRPIHYFVRLEMIIALETDIDRLVHVLETIPTYRLGMTHQKP